MLRSSLYVFRKTYKLVSVPGQLISLAGQLIVSRNTYKSSVAVISLPEEL